MQNIWECKILVSQELCSVPQSLLGVYGVCLGKQREYICGLSLQFYLFSMFINLDEGCRVLSHTQFCVHSKVLCGLGLKHQEMASLQKL